MSLGSYIASISRHNKYLKGERITYFDRKSSTKKSKSLQKLLERKATEAQLQAIRNKLRQERRRERIQFMLVLPLGLGIVWILATQIG